MAKYDPIFVHLESLPPTQGAHRLSMNEIDGVLGVPLPLTARGDRTWWANTKGSTHARCWLRAGWKVEAVDLPAGTVTFARLNGSPSQKHDRQAAFARLHQFFLSLPAQQEQIALTFDEIEAIIERKLRPTALHDRTWWANAGAYEPAKYWLSAGWSVEAVYMKSRIIVFRRKGTDVLESVHQWVKRFLDTAPVVGGPDARTIAAWIQHCRRVHWYFEGTVLYERSGCSFDSLDERERSELDEDYDVCRRELTRYQQAHAGNNHVEG